MACNKHTRSGDQDAMSKLKEMNAEVSSWLLRTEYIIAAFQLVFAAMLAALYFFTPSAEDALNSGMQSTGRLLLTYLFIASIGMFLLRFERIIIPIGWVRLFVDFAFLTLIIQSFQYKYGAVEASLEAPTLLYYFIFIAFQAMRFNPVHIIVAGGLACAGWLLILSKALETGATRTNSYLEYVTGGGILVGAEVEKIIVFLMFSTILGYAMHRARRTLTNSFKAKLNEAKMQTEASKLNEHNLRVETEKLKAESSSQAKSDFLAKISHELRTPLNGIVGIAKNCDIEKNPAALEQHIDILNQSSVALLSIVNNILDVTAIENDDIVLEEEAICLVTIVKEVIAENQSLLNNKNIELSTNINETVPFLLGDARRLKTIIHQIIENAIRFTEEGHITVTLQTKDETDAVLVYLSVEDTGIGITAEQHDKIFKLFEQCDNTRTRNFDGLGLGLSIANALIKKMGGQISFTSQANKGTKFDVSISFQKYERTAKDDIDESDAFDHRTFKILIAEDNPVNQMVLKALLSDLPYELTFANDGQLAVEAYDPDEIDIILMDLSMPNMDGITASKKIRAIEQKHGHTPVPIVALTAHISDQTRKECMEVGMSDYLTKPVMLDTLQTTLLKHLKQSTIAA